MSPNDFYSSTFKASVRKKRKNCLLFIFYMKMIIVNVSWLIGRIKRGVLLKTYSIKASLVDA